MNRRHHSTRASHLHYFRVTSNRAVKSSRINFSTDGNLYLNSGSGQIKYRRHVNCSNTSIISKFHEHLNFGDPGNNIRHLKHQSAPDISGALRYGLHSLRIPDL